MSAPKALKDFNDLKDPKDPNDFKDLKDVKDLKGFKEQYVKWLKDHAGRSFEGLRLLGAFARAKADGKTVSQFLAPITRKYANSGEMNFTVDDKPAAIARVLEAAKELGAETGRSDIDGYRIEYAEGWVSVRQSNTEPLLRLLVECDTPARLASWRATLVAALQS